MCDPPKGQEPFTGGDHLVFDDFAAALLYDTQVGSMLLAAHLPVLQSFRID